MVFFLLAASVVSLPFLYLILSTIQQYLRLRHFDGPFWAKFTDIYFVWISYTGRQHTILGEIADKCGMPTATQSASSTNEVRPHLSRGIKHACDGRRISP